MFVKRVKMIIYREIFDGVSSSSIEKLKCWDVINNYIASVYSDGFYSTKTIDAKQVDQKRNESYPINTTIFGVGSTINGYMIQIQSTETKNNVQFSVNCLQLILTLENMDIEKFLRGVIKALTDTNTVKIKSISTEYETDYIVDYLDDFNNKEHMDTFLAESNKRIANYLAHKSEFCLSKK